MSGPGRDAARSMSTAAVKGSGEGGRCSRRNNFHASNQVKDGCSDVSEVRTRATRAAGGLLDNLQEVPLAFPAGWRSPRPTGGGGGPKTGARTTQDHLFRVRD